MPSVCSAWWQGVRGGVSSPLGHKDTSGRGVGVSETTAILLQGVPAWFSSVNPSSALIPEC